MHHFRGVLKEFSVRILDKIDKNPTSIAGHSSSLRGYKIKEIMSVSKLSVTVVYHKIVSRMTRVQLGNHLLSAVKSQAPQ